MIPQSMAEELHAIPTLPEGDAALVEVLLRGAGFWYLKEGGLADCPARLFVRARDLEAIKNYLAAFRVSRPFGDGGPIPW